MERWNESGLSICGPQLRPFGLLVSASAPDERFAWASADGCTQEGTLRIRDVAHEFRRAGEIRFRTSRLRFLPHHGRKWQTRLYGARQTGRQRLYWMRVPIDVHEPDRPGGAGKQDTR